MAQELMSESKQKKLEKKKKKQQEKRRKRINSKIDRTVAFLVILIYIIFAVLEARDCLPKV